MDELKKRQLVAFDVERARKQGLPMVALETAVVTHGLPAPQNLILAQDMEQVVRTHGATPATIGILEGKIIVGMNQLELEQLAAEDDPLKISPRNFATALLQGRAGGTTVAGTMVAASAAGIKVMATGGIGGVHREHRFDVSSDLKALAEIPMLVVCAGAKSILDLPATLEYLETMNVPVIGYRTNKFPEFFSTGKRYPVGLSLDTTEDIARFVYYHWGLGLKSAVLVCQQVPSHAAFEVADAEAVEQQASHEALEQKVSGQQLTPFLLKRVNELSNGRSMRANLALLLNNAELAAGIARAMTDFQRQQSII
jgi:pseudouridine-5'-phosphate glycosidase